MDSPLTYFSLSHSIKPPALSLLLLNDVATIRRSPSTCVTLETTINRGGVRQLKNIDFSMFSPATIFGWRTMTMDLPMMSSHDVDRRDSTSLSVALKLYDDASDSLTNIIKVGEGLGTPTNVRSVSAAHQSIAGRWTAVNSPFERS